MSAGSGLLTKYTSYKPHLAKNRSDGIGGEVAKLRADLAAQLAPVAAIAVEEWTNAPAAGVALLKTNIATSVAAVVYQGAADLNGTVGGAVFVAPRTVSVTQVTAGNHYVGSVTFFGLDAMGKAISEAVALTVNPGGANTTTSTTKFFAQVTRISVPAQLDAGAFLSFGVSGVAIGLARKIKTRAGANPFLMFEYVDGAVVATGAVSATALPYGSYTPAAAPNGAHDYAIYYEFDATQG